MPRLVRLNPNVPWKTRGNAAVVLPLGLPQGPATRVGELRGNEIRAFPDGTLAVPTLELIDRVWNVIRATAQPDAQPSVAWFAEPPPALSYWQAVRGRVEPDEARRALDSLGTPYRTTTGRSLIGCLAAAAWPGPASSYEFIAYREPTRWGTERQVGTAPLLGLDASGATFHTIDPDEDGRLVCVPHGPDPVLIGLRGRDPDTLLQASVRTLPLALQEPVDGWLLWATNQASGNHVAPVATAADAPEWGTVDLPVTVAAMPENHHGGHVHVAVRDAAGQALTAIAFEPTKGLRDIVRALRPGDGLRMVGALADGALRLEKLRVNALAEHLVKQENPKCPACARSMKSAGVGQGYRCRVCKTKAPPEAAGWAPAPRSIALGWHEVPIMARRHLHRPVVWG